MHAFILAAALAGPLPQAPPVLDEPQRVIPACVKIGAEWCGPCRMDHPHAAGLEADGWNIHFIDSDARPGWVANHRVTALPTYILFDANQKELRRHVGRFGSRQAMVDWLGRESLPDEFYYAPVEQPEQFCGSEDRLHAHRCDNCGLVWWHTGEQAAADPRSHNCRRCGRYQNVVHAWAGE